MHYYNIQALRAVAAWCVVLHHLVDYVANYIDRGNPHVEFGSLAAGVDVFFVISGFIMGEIVARPTTTLRGFLIARVSRIVPLYWLLTSVAVGAMALGLHIFGWHHGLSLGHVLASYAFMPPLEAAGRPILYVGWTLNYEMMFYAILGGALLAATLRRRVQMTLAALVALFLAGRWSDNGYLAYWGDPIIFEFAGGMAISLWGKSRAPAKFCLAVLVLSVMTLGFAEFWLGMEGAMMARGYIWGPCALGMVWSAVALEVGGHTARARWVQFQGNACYSLYLSHPFVLQAVGKGSLWLGLCGTPWTNSCSVALALVGCAVAGPTVHVALERPLNGAVSRWLYARLGRGRADPRAVHEREAAA